MQIIYSCIFAMLYLMECVVYCGTSAVVFAVVEDDFASGTDTAIWMQCVLLCTF